MSNEIHLSITGMKCDGCKTAVEKALSEVAGIDFVEISLEESSATVRGTADPAEVVRAVTEAGYPATLA